MTPRQIGAFWLICCHAWRGTTVGRMLNDPQRLMRLARLSAAEWEVDGPAILAGFDTSDPKWVVQKRLVREWEKQQARRAQAVAAGKRSGEVRRTTVEHPFVPRSTKPERTANPSSVSVSSSVSSVPPTPTHRGGVGIEIEFQDYKRRLGDIFKRDPDKAWSEYEIRGFSSLVRQPTFPLELGEIQGAYHKGLQWLPQSLGRLLEDWTGTLDKARQETTFNGKPARKAPVLRDIDRTLARIEAQHKK